MIDDYIYTLLLHMSCQACYYYNRQRHLCCIVMQSILLCIQVCVQNCEVMVCLAWIIQEKDTVSKTSKTHLMNN